MGANSMSIPFLRLLAGFSLTLFAAGAGAEIKTVPRYDDADEYLPIAERRNTSGIRLFLRQQDGEALFKVTTPRDVTVDVVARIPPGATHAVVFFLGGTSVLSIANDKLDRSFSFQPRSRDAWWEQGFATFLVDAPSDRLGREGIQDTIWRTRGDHRQDLQAVLAAVTERFPGPLVLHGHSNGTASLANAAQLKMPNVKAYMYSGASHLVQGAQLVYQVEHPAPVLLVQHRNDTCAASDFASFAMLERGVRAPVKKTLLVEGGIAPMSGPCGPFAPHSFVGQEAQTIRDAIVLLKGMMNP